MGMLEQRCRKISSFIKITKTLTKIKINFSSTLEITQRRAAIQDIHEKRLNIGLYSDLCSILALPISISFLAS